MTISYIWYSINSTNCFPFFRTFVYTRTRTFTMTINLYTSESIITYLLYTTTESNDIAVEIIFNLIILFILFQLIFIIFYFAIHIHFCWVLGVFCVVFFLLLSYDVPWQSEFMLWYPLRFPHKNNVRGSSVSPVVGRGAHVLFSFFVSCADSGVQHILCGIFLLCLASSCCQFLWIIHSWLHLRYSLTFIH